MFKFKRDYKKCLSILNSCETFGQLNTTMNLISNYGGMYNFNGYYRKLHIKGIKMWYYLYDKLEYTERLESVKKTPIST